MTHDQIVGLTVVAVFGFLARWLAWRLRFPAILLLLLCGLVAGPVTGILRPNELLGEGLLPLVSLGVAVILFEGGLGLRFRELREVSAVRNLVTIGALVTWILTTGLAVLALNLSWQVALLLGALLTVTGPTVILPLLHYVRPKGEVAIVARWEGILIDPIGALLAVLVYEAFASKLLEGWSPVLVWHYLSGIGLGCLVGAIAAGLMMLALRYFLIPDDLLNSFSLAMVVGTFALSNFLREETGIVAVTFMGIVLANQKWVSVQEIIEFKENLRVLLISSLFIVLAARVEVASLSRLGWGTALFIAGLIFYVRPASVYLSTIGTGLSPKEKFFLAGLAPRGIVAAAVSSILDDRLAATGHPEAGVLVPIVFAVVVATVAFYGLAAAPLANRLKISDSNPQGVLLIGAHRKLFDLAVLLRGEGIPVAFVDNSWAHVTAARMRGLTAYLGNPASEALLEKIDFQGIGRVLCMMPVTDTNSLAALQFRGVMGRSNTYQIRAVESAKASTKTAQHLTGRPLFGNDMDYAKLSERLEGDTVFKTTTLTPVFGIQEFSSLYGEEALPFFLLETSGKLTVLTDGLPKKFPDNCRLISLVRSQAIGQH
ncbi:MAG: sodium:proton antiporter [Bryobacter sp.]